MDQLKKNIHHEPTPVETEPENPEIPVESKPEKKPKRGRLRLRK